MKNKDQMSDDSLRVKQEVRSSSLRPPTTKPKETWVHYFDSLADKPSDALRDTENQRDSASHLPARSGE